jgi:hypothetical protein
MTRELQQAGTGVGGSGLDGTVELLARIFASSYQAAGFSLDGTLLSAGELDRLAIMLARLEPTDLPTCREVQDFVDGAGSYLGSLVVKHFGGTWVPDASGQPQIVGLGQRVVRPYEWVQTRVQGEGESLLRRLADLQRGRPAL